MTTKEPIRRSMAKTPEPQTSFKAIRPWFRQPNRYWICSTKRLQRASSFAKKRGFTVRLPQHPIHGIPATGLANTLAIALLQFFDAHLTLFSTHVGRLYAQS